MLKKINDFIDKCSGILRVIEFCLVVLAIILIITLINLVGKTFRGASDALSQAAISVSEWLEAQTATMDYKPEIMLTQLETKTKFVTLQASFDVTIEKRVENRMFYDYLPAGSAEAKIHFKDNKVQFYVPMNEIKASDIIFNEKNEILTINVPRARLDKDIIEVQTDPDKVLIETKDSWVPFFGPKTQNLIEEVRADARREIIIQAGKMTELQQHADEHAQQFLTEFLRKLFADFLSRGHRKLNVVYPYMNLP